MFNSVNDFNRVSSQQIFKAVHKLKVGLDFNSIHSYHLKYGSELLFHMLAKFLTCCISHGYMPTNLIRGVIIPLVKDKLGKLDEVKNYRPIMSSSIILKVIEYVLLDKLSNYFINGDQQHGYKAGSSTSTACFVLKEVVSQYFKENTPVYSSFFDFSKAFDCVILSEKMF